MRIAILTSGIMPVPAVQGGAVEILIDFYLEHNDKHQLHDITVYSIWHPEVEHHPALKSKANRYIFIKTDTWWAKLKKILYKHAYNKGYYHSSIEYYLCEALRRMRRESFDIVVIENRPGFILTASKKVKAHWVLHLHNDFLNKETKYAQEILASYHRVINVSDFITKQVASINPSFKQNLTVHNAIDAEYFSHAKASNRTELGFNDHHFIIIYSGRLTKEKGILQLIKAIKTTDLSSLRLLIIGASAYGKDKSPTPFIQQLREEAEPVKNQIVFTGYVDYQQVPAYLKMSDLAVVPSVWEEPFGLTVVEAMAAGLPLITTRSGGIPEICEGAAIIIEKEHLVDHLSEAILDLYKHPEKRKAMAEASLKRSKLFDKETYAKNFFAALEL